MQAQVVTNVLRDGLALSQQSARLPAEGTGAPRDTGPPRRAKPSPIDGYALDAAQEIPRERDERKFEEAAQRIRQVIESFQRDLHFEVHKETGIMYVKVTDVQDGKVLRELPMEQILDTLARIEKVVGLLVDGEA